MGDTIIKPITIPITGVALNALKVDQTIKAAKGKDGICNDRDNLLKAFRNIGYTCSE